MIILNYLYSSIIILISLVIALGYAVSYSLTKEKRKIACAIWFLFYIFGEIFRMTLVILPSSVPSGSDITILSYLDPLVQLCYITIVVLETSEVIKFSKKIILGVTVFSIIVFTAFGIKAEALYIISDIWVLFELYPKEGWTERRKVFFVYSVIMLCTQVLHRVILPMTGIPTSGLTLTICTELVLYLSMLLGASDVYICLKEQHSIRKADADTRNIDDRALLDSIAESCGLSVREKEIVHMLLDGKTNKEIGDSLFIAEGTVKSHVHKLLQKLGIRSRKELYSLLRSGEVSNSSF